MDLIDLFRLATMTCDQRKKYKMWEESSKTHLVKTPKGWSEKLYTKDAKYKIGDIAHRSDGDYEKIGSRKWHKISKEKELDEETKSEKLQFSKPSSIMECRKFKNNLEEAKSTCSKDKAWRVDTGHEESDYLHDNICTTAGGSVAAVTPEGDIISVCHKAGDNIRGKQLLQDAVSAGGKKLDSYAGNFGFYVKCGFEPVSWCEFNEEYAPDDWNKDFEKEPVIFFKYVGIGNVHNDDKDDFINNTRASRDYDQAQYIRDKEVQ